MRLTLTLERGTQRYLRYSVEPQLTVLRDTIYLDRLSLMQEFGPAIPIRLTLEITEPQDK